ncbi:MAG: M56 family metallopeptidase [Ferruginibacter sp.]
MPLLFSIQVHREEIIQAINWTLIHSLWQGMLLALVAGSIVFFTKKVSPSLRYNLLAGSLLLFIIVVAATFSMQLIKANLVANTVQATPAANTIAIGPAMPLLPVEPGLSLPGKIVVFLNEHANWIVLIWILMIGLQFTRLAAGLYGVYQLKRRHIFSPGEYWNNRINELGRHLQINKSVKLLQSGIARIPAVIGYFKPVILFPAGLLASLPANEVEAILIHELAHIRRKDFLVNLLQNMIEIIFFFNPAVLWVSSLIKSERENCCDDIAVCQTDSKRNYINALLAFQGSDLHVTGPLMNAFGGEKDHLMNRVKRIIYNSNKTLNNMEKKFLAAGMIITTIFIFAFTSNNLQQKAIVKDTASYTEVVPAAEVRLPVPLATRDTVPGKDSKHSGVLNGTINSTVNGQKYKLVIEHGRIAELYVNGKKIPAEKIAGYKSITDPILLQSKLDMEHAEKDSEQARKEMAESKADMEESEKDVTRAKLEMEKAKEEMEQDMEQAKKEMEQNQLEMAQSKKEMEQAKLEMEHAKMEMAQDMEQAKREMEKAKLEMGEAKKKMALEMEEAKIEMEHSKKDFARSKNEVEQSRKEMERSSKIQAGFIEDLIKEHILKGKEELSTYKLSNEELIVNGVKQAGAIHKKFKDKYVKGDNWTMEYNGAVQ